PLHRDVEVSVYLAEVVDRDDVGMLERPGRLRLSQESFAQIVVLRECLAHDLDRDAPLEHWVERAIDDAHRAFTDALLDVVLSDLGGAAGGQEPVPAGSPVKYPVGEAARNRALPLRRQLRQQIDDQARQPADDRAVAARSEEN